MNKQEGKNTPFWNARYGRQVSSGRWLLAMESVGITMLDFLIPGITNITKHARYYSLHAWLLKHFLETSADHSEKAFRKFRAPVEMAFSLAYCLHHVDGDLRGIDQVNVLSSLWSSKKTEFELDTENFRGSEWIYHSVMRQLKIVEDDPDERLVGSLVKPLGQKLAEEFERNIAGTKFFSLLSSGKPLRKISRDALLELADRACLCRLTAVGGKEREIMQQIFFRLDLKGSEAPVGFGNRRKTLLLLLDMVRLRAGEKFERRDFEDLAYYWKYDKKVGYAPPPFLKDIAEYWRLFWARQQLVYAILTCFAYLLEEIVDRTTTLDAFIEKTIDGLDLKKTAKELTIDLGSFDPRELSIADMLVAVQKSVGVKKSDMDSGVEFDRLCGHGEKISESVLTDAIEANLDNKNAQKMVAYASICLLTTFIRTRPYLKTSYEDYLRLGDEGDNYRVSTAALFNELEARLQSTDFTVAKFIRWIFEDFVVSQHLRVAFAKWRTGNDTFAFVQDGETIRGLTETRPQFNNMRFQETLTMLVDVGLLKTKGDDAYELTKMGRDALEAGKAFYEA